MITRKRLVIGFVLIVLTLIVFRVGSRVLKKEKVTSGPVQSGVPVAVSLVERKDIHQTLILTGDVRGLNEAKVYPKVPGRLLRKIKDTGDLVKKDEVVAMVDRNEPALQFAAAEVTSALDGVITRYFVDLGAAVTPSTPVCEVADISPVKVVVMVAEKDLPKIKVGQTARFFIDAFPKDSFTGRVTRISEALTLGSRAAEVEIQSQNPQEKLKPGMFAKVEIIVAVHGNSIVVPREAVAQIGGSYYSFVIQNGISQRRDLQIGVIKEKELEVLSGLSAGDTLVTLGWHNLTEGTKVEVVEMNGQQVNRKEKN